MNGSTQPHFSPDAIALLSRDPLRVGHDVLTSAQLIGAGGASSVGMGEVGWTARLNDLKEVVEANRAMFLARQFSDDKTVFVRTLIDGRALCRFAESNEAAGGKWEWLRDVCRAWVAVQGLDYDEVSRTLPAPKATLAVDTSDGEAGLSPREKRKQGTVAKRKEWERLAVAYLKADPKRTHGKVAELVAKEIKVDSKTVRRWIPRIGVLRELAAKAD